MSMVGNLKRISPALLNELLQGEVELEEVLYGEEEVDQSLYLDKSWHAIHYLLNGAAWEGEEPLVHTVLGGTAIGEPDEDEMESGEYNPTRYLTPELVKQISDALQGITEVELQSRYNPEQMTEMDIYPSIDWEDDGELEYVMDYYRELVAYYRDAAANQEAMLLYIT
ncbi:YfbM family protein [Paenibacillus sp. PR3]|uniref:YfbM family protein n=1 Tax=Paenibacillus terricola TaxID=2763503 RepID=A0ABR8N6Y0_9BACL|nr:YfbM family protein [Paenibacillus terricola]MBD3922619.1 YfbM family protein [Paenibacillus terricola]